MQPNKYIILFWIQNEKHGHGQSIFWAKRTKPRWKQVEIVPLRIGDQPVSTLLKDKKIKIIQMQEQCEPLKKLIWINCKIKY